MRKNREILINRAWELLKEKGLEGLTPELLADQSHISLYETTLLCPTPLSVLLLLWNEVEERAINLQNIDLNPHDYLFETLMNHLDVLESHREATQRFTQELAIAPCWFWDIKPYAKRWSRKTLEAARVNLNGIQGEIKITVFSLFCLHILKTWCQDETPDRSETLSAIDQGLSKLEEWQSKIRSMDFTSFYSSQNQA